MEDYLFESSIAIPRQAADGPSPKLVAWVKKCLAEADSVTFYEELGSVKQLLSPKEHGRDGKYYYARGIVKDAD